MEEKTYFVHESSYIDEGCEIGEGTKIWHFSHIMKGCRIGKNCNIGQNVVVSPDVVLGDGCKVQNNVSIYTGVVCEDGVFLGPSCVFTNVINPRAFIGRKSEYRKTTLKKGASVGANATIVCGHDIGCYAFVGAGAVVARNVPDYAMVYGCPAEIKGWGCQCEEQIKFASLETICPVCGKRYQASMSNTGTVLAVLQQSTRRSIKSDQMSPPSGQFDKTLVDSFASRNLRKEAA